MPHYLITLSIGPVQDFIAAARKTRDLWMGSYLLSEISKAAAKSLNESGGELIFPAVNSANKLEPCKEPHKNCFNVGNKLLALVKTDNPQEIVKQAEDAAKNRWKEIALKAKNSNKAKGIKVDDDIWNKQIDDVLEIFAAWLIFNTQKDQQDSGYYKEKRERLDELLNARKNTRQFIANPVETPGIPKSALDGLRESVINPEKISKAVLRKAGLNKGEYLDCPGIAKRLAEDKMLEQFTPLSRLAVDPWLRSLDTAFDLNELKNIMKPLVTAGLVSRVKGNTNNGQSIYATFPYDGQLLYDFRRDLALADKDNADIQDEIKAANQFLETLKNPDNSPPLPYMAILAADGDRMGELLDNMQSLEAHQNISAKLSEFAENVPETVRTFRGHCVYAGGDDVLALLPLDQAIACSRKLADDFKATLQQIPDIPENKIPTLSVGLGISHFMTPMPKQLDLARKAEKLAKSNESDDPKNALAIILSPRSGAEICFREKWNNDADKILCQWIKAHIEDKIPRQAGYNLRESAIQLNWATINKDVLKKETRRIMERKQTTEGKVEDRWIKNVCDRVEKKGLNKASDELIMTYRFAQAYKLANTNCTLEKGEDSHV